MNLKEPYRMDTNSGLFLDYTNFCSLVFLFHLFLKNTDDYRFHFGFEKPLGNFGFSATMLHAVLAAPP